MSHSTVAATSVYSVLLHLVKNVPFQQLCHVHENVFKSKCSNQEDLLNVWQMEARRSGTTFFNVLSNQFEKIGREDIAQQLMELQNDVEDKKQPLLSKRDKRLRSNCCILTLTVLLVVNTVLLCCFIALLSITAAVFLQQQEPVYKVIAEDDTVSLITVDKLTVSSVTITEVLKAKGDHDHRVLLTLVATANITYSLKVQTDSWNGTTIVNELPIINEMYVYLNQGSTLEYEICMGNGTNADSTRLYIFDNEDQYIDFMEDEVLDSPVLSKIVNIGGQSKTICNTINFIAESNSYYFIVMIAPEKSIKFSYNVTANEKVVDIHKYTTKYPRCIVSSDNDKCTLSTSSSTFPSSENLTVLAYTEPNYDFNSKISHLELSFSSRSYIATVPSVLLGVFVVLWIVLMILVVVTVVWRKRQYVRKHNGYLVIN